MHRTSVHLHAFGCWWDTGMPIELSMLHLQVLMCLLLVMLLDCHIPEARHGIEVEIGILVCGCRAGKMILRNLMLLMYLAIIKTEHVHGGVHVRIHRYVDGHVCILARWFSIALIQAIQGIERQLQIAKFQEIGEFLVRTGHHGRPPRRRGLIHCGFLTYVQLHPQFVNAFGEFVGALKS